MPLESLGPIGPKPYYPSGVEGAIIGAAGAMGGATNYLVDQQKQKQNQLTAALPTLIANGLVGKAEPGSPNAFPFAGTWYAMNPAGQGSMQQTRELKYKQAQADYKKTLQQTGDIGMPDYWYNEKANEIAAKDWVMQGYRESGLPEDQAKWDKGVAAYERGLRKDPRKSIARFKLETHYEKLLKEGKVDKPWAQLSKEDQDRMIDSWMAENKDWIDRYLGKGPKLGE